MPKKIISDKVIKKTSDIITTWKGKLTWDLLCERVTKECGLETKVSRHTLLEYEEIKLAFNGRKEWLKENPTPLRETENLQLQDAYTQIDKLRAENKRLEDEKDAVREQFVRWQNNLYQMGINMDKLQSELNKPLSSIDRANDNRRKR
jgi:hypothetical protein